jgi:hypothetical protein
MSSTRKAEGGEDLPSHIPKVLSLVQVKVPSIKIRTWALPEFIFMQPYIFSYSYSFIVSLTMANDRRGQKFLHFWHVLQE